MRVSSKFTAPHHSYEDIRQKAEEFLTRCHPQGAIPIPIEEIVEFQLEMDIIPMPGLQDLIETDGFITSDLREIYVDEFIYSRRSNRYRFTLAHEIGHAMLHGKLYEQQSFQSIDEWKAFLNSIPDEEHAWLEYQAYAFAGLVLVPRSALVRDAERCVELVKSKGIGMVENWDFVWSYIASFLSKGFQVSEEVIEKRLPKDRVPEQFMR